MMTQADPANPAHGPTAASHRRALEFVFHRHRSELAPVDLGCAGLFFVLAVAAVVGYVWTCWPRELDEPSWLLAFGAPTLLFVVLAIVFGWRGAKEMSFERSEAYDAIVRRGRDAVWFYARTTDVTTRYHTVITYKVVKTKKQLLGAVVIGYRDRTAVEIPIIPAYSTAAIDALRAELPHCTVGYSPELEQAFLANPLSLLRGPETRSPVEPRRDGPVAASFTAGGRRVQYAARTHLGRPDGITRERVLLQPDVELFCIVSGIGHAPGLSVCAAADPIRDAFEALARTYPAGLPPPLARQTLVEAIQRGHEGVRRLLGIGPPDQQFGATIAAVLLLPDRAVVAHVGAERVHRCRDGQLEQLTVDHSMLEDYFRTFVVPSSDVDMVKRTFPHKNVINRALGVQVGVDVEVREHALAPGDLLAITTQSVGDALGLDTPGVERMRLALAVGDTVEGIADRLLRMGVESGPQDNFAVVVIRVA